MRFALQIYSAHSGSRRVWLDATKPLRVGRTTRAELTVPEDPHISGVHFSLTLSGSQVLLQDLQSRNGTFVNGAKVSSLAIQDGDVIVAGRTQFQLIGMAELPGAGVSELDPTLRPEWDSVPSRTISPSAGNFDYERTESIAASQNPLNQRSRSPHDSKTIQHYPRLSSRSFKDVRRNAGLGSDYAGRTKPPSKPAPNDPPPGDVGPIAPLDSMCGDFPEGLSIRYETRLAPSGMTYFCPRSEAKAPTDVADFIGKNRFLYAMVNFSRLHPQRQASFYHEAIAAGGVQVSRTQLLIPKRDATAFHSIFEQTWSQDSIVCMASRLNKVEFMPLAYRLSAELTSPSALLNRLYSDGQLGNYGVLEGISAVLLEIERGSRWIIFKNDSEIRTWRTLGLPCPPELVG